MKIRYDNSGGNEMKEMVYVFRKKNRKYCNRK